MKKLRDYARDGLRADCGVDVITATELKANLGECLTLTQLGKSYCIKRKGQIMGFLVSERDADVTHEVLTDGTCATISEAK